MDTLKVNDRLKLHLGCGAVDFGKGWIHIDSGNYDHVQYHDVSRLPFYDGHVEIIYASHLLAYFDREQGLEVLKEWARVLTGTLYIAVPDFEAMAKLYVSGKWPIEDFLGPLYGKMNEPPIYHKTAYDERTLCKALHKAGFRHIHRISDGLPQGNNKDQSYSYLPDRTYEQGTLISLNLIATK